MSRYAYITNTDSNTISVVDLQTTEEVKQVEIGDSPRGAMAIDKKRGLGYVSNCAGDTVSVIDLNSDKEYGRIRVGLAPRGVEISADSNYLFVTNSGSASVSIVDLSIKKEVKNIEVGRNPRQLSISPNSEYIYVPNFGSDSISIIKIDYTNIDNTKVITEIPLVSDAKPYHVYPNEDGTLLFTANTFNHSVSVIDVAREEVIRTISVGYNPRAVITEPTGKYLFVSAEASNAVSVVDRKIWQEIERIPVGPTPRGLIVDEVNNYVLVTAFDRTKIAYLAGQDRISIISIDTLKRIGNLPSGLGACSINIVDTKEIEKTIIDKSKRDISPINRKMA